MKNQPTKKQLVDRLAHFETRLKSFIDSVKAGTAQNEYGDFEGNVDVHEVVGELSEIVDSAPSITPVPKADSTDQEAAQ